MTMASSGGEGPSANHGIGLILEVDGYDSSCTEPIESAYAYIGESHNDAVTRFTLQGEREQRMVFE